VLLTKSKSILWVNGRTEFSPRPFHLSRLEAKAEETISSFSLAGVNQKSIKNEQGH
jgi:hypothetical protein